jgi:hypothetical protein
MPHASHDPRPRATAAFALLLAVLLVPAAHAEPFLFPETPESPAEWRDARDTAPYLAAWKAEGLRRTRAAAQAATPNQTAYDVTWYDLQLTPVHATQVLTGTTRVKARVVSGPLANVELDLYSNLVVDAVSAAGLPSTYSRAGDLLTVALDRAYATGETFELTVTYHGTPTGGSFGFNTANGRPLIWSLSEPYGARSWWPCKDVPEDKADSVDIRVWVPSGIVTASNGTRVAATDNGTTAFTHWKERYPITTYLVAIACYPYATSHDWYRPTPADSMPIDFFNFPESVSGAAAVQAKVKDMIAAFVADFGPYPFLAEKYGHAQFLFGGGMEHQTCTFLGVYNEYVVAHELGHQWWGDWVTCRDFHHIWINEGFATYSEALWAEALGGMAAYHADLDLNRYFGPGSVYVVDDTDEAAIFSSNLSYNKGSWVLHMLRRVLGDAVFFDALREFGTTFAYGTATTEDFRGVCEAVSGRDLTKYFQQWVYGEYYPAYRARWSAAPAAGGWDVTLTLEQTQAWQLFTMPVDVRVTTASGSTTFTVQDSLASQVFVLRVAEPPTQVAVDPDGWILKTLEAPVVNPPLDKGVLVVNGVSWNDYGTEITSAYQDRAFFGDHPIDFWDHFPPPSGGYPSTLPAPLGRGAVPPEVMGRYRVVVWVGNDFNGDLASWVNSPILSYLKAGGDVLLLTRNGGGFLTDSLRAYLGVGPLTSTTLLDCLAARPGLTDIARIGTQSSCVHFDTTLTRSDSQVLFKARTGLPGDRGIGAIRIPPNGGTHRLNGGRFAFLSGRPYRWNHAALRANVSTILGSWFLEPLDPLAAGPAPPPAALALAPPRPNPSGGVTTLVFTLPRAADVRAEVLDVAGRVVRTLASGPLPAGEYALRWDGRDDAGRRLGVGVYWARVDAAGAHAARRLVRVD